MSRKTSTRAKIVGERRIAALASASRRAGKRIVFTNGCFDLLHRGHVEYLQASAALGDELIVGVNTDASIRRLKGPARPLQPLGDRCVILSALACVTCVVPFSGNTPIALIKKIKPHVLVKGADWAASDIVGGDFVRAHGGRVARIRLTPDRSTSNLVKSIIKKHG